MNQTMRTSWWDRNWKWFLPVSCLLAVFLFAGFIGLIFYGVTSMIRSSEVYQMALQSARKNPELVSALGEPIVEGIFITGNISEGGASGSADLAIPISGPRGEATLYVVARESAGQWTFRRLIVEISKTEDRIDLLQEKETLDQ